MIYIIILLYTLFLVYNYDIKKTKKGFQFHYVALLVICICVSGFSYRLGMDTVGYMYYFEHSVDGDLGYTLMNLADYRYEPIPTLLFSIVKGLTGSFVVLQFVIAQLTPISAACFFTKNIIFAYCTKTIN